MRRHGASHGQGEGYQLTWSKALMTGEHSDVNKDGIQKKGNKCPILSVFIKLEKERLLMTSMGVSAT